MSGNVPFALAECDLDLLAAILDGQTADAHEQRRALEEIRQHPDVLTPATIRRCVKLYEQQRDSLSQHGATLVRWETLSLTAAQRIEVARLQTELKHLYAELTNILALMAQWKRGGSDAQQTPDNEETPVAMQYVR